MRPDTVNSPEYDRDGSSAFAINLDMALYDGVGRALGVPVHRLLNRPKVGEAQ